MELEEFGRLLIVHGANVREWPQAVRRDAEALILRSDEAARLCNDAACIDQIYRETGAPVAPESIERILAKLESVPLDVPQTDDVSHKTNPSGRH